MSIESITYAGHSAVFLNSNQATIAIDPWLSGNPRCPDELQNPSKLDLILLTHGHPDHAGDAVRLAKQFGAAVAATFELTSLLAEEGVPEHNLLPMNKGGSMTWKGFRITLTNAFHSSSFDSSNGTRYAGEPCGVIVDDGTRRIYHAGDTCLFSDLQLIGELYSPQVALLPIGDRFTMGPREAARAAKFVRCKTAIPIHYATFDALTGTPEEFSKECESFGIGVSVLEPGQSFKL